MGLDLVELVMAVEERFGITLSDDDAMSAETPGKLIDLIYAKLDKGGSGECLTSRAFYLVRRALMQQFEWHRSQIVPAARLEELVPRKNRREAWQRLRVALQANQWPSLKRPPWLVGIIFALFCAMLVVALVLHLDGVSPWLTLPAVLAVLGLVMLATRPLCLEFPKERATVGQLTRFVVAYCPALFGPVGRRWSRADVAAAVRELTIEELGLTQSQYREDAHFVKDLHAN